MNMGLPEKKRTACSECGELLELEKTEIEAGEFECPECGAKNKIKNDKEGDSAEQKALLIDDSYADCIYCGNTKELSQNEIIGKSFKCPECREINELEIKTKFKSQVFEENSVQCANCRAILELEPEEILAKYFLCSECRAINEIEEKAIYSKFNRETKEGMCIKCERKLILEVDEIDRKYFFCPKCSTENFIE
jgi:predicted RNA-binding Zn-ribbon protein involved in translation (DUF1610 family)